MLNGNAGVVFKNPPCRSGVYVIKENDRRNLLHDLIIKIFERGAQLVRVGVFTVHHQYGFLAVIYEVVDIVFYKSPCIGDFTVADGLFCREIDGLFCRSSPDIIVRRRCVLSHKRRGWLQPSPSFRYSRNLALQDELYHPVINNGPAVLVCVDKRLGTGPVNQSRDAG